MPRTSFEALGQFRVDPPGIDEQRRVAEFLDAELDLLDASEARLRRMRELVEERIDTSSSLQLRCSRLLKSNADLPDGWRLTRLKFLARLQTGLTLGKRYPAAELVERPYVRVANVQDGRVALSDVSTISLPEPDVARYELRPGDVLMTEGGDNDKLGRGATWNGEIAGCLHQNHMSSQSGRIVLACVRSTSQP